MSIIKKSSFPLHLNAFSVFINDTLPTSRYFKITQLPDTLTGGKNAFSIQGSTELKEGSYLFVEVKDSNGNIIYSEPAGGKPSDYYEGVAKPVSIHVYEDTLFGPATITIVGELKEYDDNGIIRPIPDEWRGKINVKWQRTVNVNPFLANTTPIRLYKRPKIDISEKLLGIYKRTNSQVSYNGHFRAVAIDPVDGTNYPYNGPIQYEVVSINPTSASFFSAPPIPLSNIPATPFNKGSVNRQLQSINVYLQNGEKGIPSSSWSPTIKSLINPYRAIVDIPYVTDRNGVNPPEIRNIAYGSWNSTYEITTVDSNPEISSSYAQIDIKDLETFSGDIYRLKIFAKSRNDLKGYSLLDDIVLEENELLQTQFYFGEINKKTGVFDINNVVTDFWSTSSIAGLGQAYTINDDNLIDSIRLEPNIEDGDREIFNFYNKFTNDYQNGVEYILSYKAVFSGNLINPDNPKGLLDVYMSGSAFNDTDDINKKGFGKKIGSLSGLGFQRFDAQSINFRPDKTGTGRVNFIVRNGNWDLADISIKAAAQTAFNPSELSILVKPNVQIPSESFDFRFELFDINYTYVPITLEKTIRFGGGNDILATIQFQFSTVLPSLQSSVAGNPPGTQWNPSVVNSIPAFNALFTISPNGITSSQESIWITASLSPLVTGPLTFDSASATAYDTSGSQILPQHVVTGFKYPGFLSEINNNGFGSQGPIYAKLDFQDFKTKIKPDSNNKPRNVGYITYTVFPTNNQLQIQPSPTFTIGSDWSNFLGCVAPVWTNVNFSPVNTSAAYYFTASNVSSAEGIDSTHIIYYKPQGSGSWFRQRQPLSDTTALISSSADTSSMRLDTEWGPDDIANYNYFVTNYRSNRYIDFKILKNCFGNTSGIFIESDELRVASAPYIEALITGNTIPLNTTTNKLINPPLTNPYYEDQGPGAVQIIQINAANLSTPNGNLLITKAGAFDDNPDNIAHSAYEISVNGGVSWASGVDNSVFNSLTIPFTNYGLNVSQDLRIRLRDGLREGNYACAITIEHVENNITPAPLSTFQVSGSVGPAGSRVILRYLHAPQGTLISNNNTYFEDANSYANLASGRVRIWAGNNISQWTPTSNLVNWNSDPLNLEWSDNGFNRTTIPVLEVSTLEAVIPTGVEHQIDFYPTFNNNAFNNRGLVYWIKSTNTNNSVNMQEVQIVGANCANGGTSKRSVFAQGNGEVITITIMPINAANCTSLGGGDGTLPQCGLCDATNCFFDQTQCCNRWGEIVVCQGVDSGGIGGGRPGVTFNCECSEPQGGWDNNTNNWANQWFWQEAQ